MPTEPTIVRLIFEYAVLTEPVSPGLAARAWGPPDNAQEAAEHAQQLAYERRLAEVLDADEALRRQLTLNTVLTEELPALEGYKGVKELLNHAYLSLLPVLLDRLPAGEREVVEAYCNEYGLMGDFHEYAPLAEQRVRLSLSRVLVEDEQGPLANSDERVRAVRKRRTDARSGEASTPPK